MGYVHIKRPDGSEIFIGLDSEADADTIITCDACNEPKPESQGEILRDGSGIDQMWLCHKCNTVTYG